MSNLKRVFAGLLATLLVGVLMGPSSWTGSSYAQAAPTTVLRVGVVLTPIEDRFRFKGGITPYETSIFETLVRLAPDMTIGPGLATSWEVVGPTTWRFNLRPGVRFHSGRPFDAAAVKRSLETSHTELRTGGITRLQSVRVVNPLTVEIETTMPFAGLPEALSHPITAIGNLDQTGTVRPDGTGPLRWVSHVIDVELVMDRNPEYWGERAKVGRVVLRILTDPMTRVLALRRGDVDVIQAVPFGSIAALEGDPRFQVHRVVAPMTQALWFNRLRPPVDDVRVRRAVAHAIDKKAIVDFVLLGIGREAPSHIPAYMPWSIHGETEGYVYAPERARALLEEAGWVVGRGGIRVKDGRPLELDMIMHILDPETTPTAESIQNMLRMVGISLRLRVLERGAYFETRDRGDFTIALGRNIIASASGEFLLHQLHKDSTGQRLARTMWIGDHVDQMIDRAAGTFEQRARFDLYRQIQRIWEAEVATVPISYSVVVHATARHVHGYQMHATTWSQRWETAEIRR